MMTNKEILRKSIVGVIEQGKPSVDGNKCMYRSEDGLKCAVGMIIDDEFYDRDLENERVKSDEVKAVIAKSVGKKPSPKLINYLFTIQYCHIVVATESCFVDKFKEGIKREVGDGALPKYCLEFIKGTTG